MNITIIMINHNGSSLLKNSLANFKVSLEKSWETHQNFEFIFVDNDSIDDSVAIVNTHLRNVKFPWRIIYEKMLGVNFARNAGIKASKGDYLIFTDNDLRFSEDWLNAFYLAFSDYPKYQVFAGRVLVGDLECTPPDWLATSGHFCIPAIVVQCDHGENPSIFTLRDAGPVGPNMAFHRSIFEQWGLFDTRFGLRPGSLVPAAEAEYFDRLASGHVSCVYVPNAIVFHPIRAQQMTKRYFLKRVYGIGRASARINRIRKTPCKRFFGITLYKFEHLVFSVFRYLSALFKTEPQERFFLFSRIFLHLGYIYEDWQYFHTDCHPIPDGK